MIFSLRVRGCANHVGFYMIPYIRAHILGVGSANARKRHCPTPERISSRTRLPCTRWPLDGKYLYLLSVGFNIIALIPIWQYFSMIRFLTVGWNIEYVNLPDEVVNLWIFAIGLTLSGCERHTSSVWPWSSTPKVRLYDTFLGGLRHLPPRMKNQHGLNEEKNHTGKKLISHLSACDVTCVLSLDTTNLKCKSLWEWRKLCFTLTIFLLLVI